MNNPQPKDLIIPAGHTKPINKPTNPNPSPKPKIYFVNNTGFSINVKHFFIYNDILNINHYIIPTGTTSFEYDSDNYCNDFVENTEPIGSGKDLANVYIV